MLLEGEDSPPPKKSVGEASEGGVQVVDKPANTKKIKWPPKSTRGSTFGEGRDTTIPSPGRSPEQPLPGMRLHDPLHGRQAWPKFIAFDQGVGQLCPR